MGSIFTAAKKVHHQRIVKVAINVDDLIKLTGWLLIVTLLINLVISIIALPIIHHRGWLNDGPTID